MYYTDVVYRQQCQCVRVSCMQTDVFNVSLIMNICNSTMVIILCEVVHSPSLSSVQMTGSE